MIKIIKNVLLLKEKIFNDNFYTIKRNFIIHYNKI